MGIKPLYFLTSFRDLSYYDKAVIFLKRSVYLDNAVHLLVLHIEHTWVYKTIVRLYHAVYLHLQDVLLYCPIFYRNLRIS